MKEKKIIIDAQEFAYDLNQLAAKWRDVFPPEANALDDIADEMRALAIHLDDHLNDNK